MYKKQLDAVVEKNDQLDEVQAYNSVMSGLAESELVLNSSRPPSKNMLLPAEVEARATIPMLRAFVAKRLIEEFGYMQKDVAQAMGVTQASISNYLRGERARMVDWGEDPEIKRQTDGIVRAVLQRRDTHEVMTKFNQTLTYIRMRRMMCEIHKKLDPEIDISLCHICDS